jgi:D-alanyl-D-alanine dipeptidase
MMKGLVYICLIASFGQLSAQVGRADFVNVQELSSSLIVDVRYFTSDNFVGTRIDGYNQPIVLLSKQAALAVSNVHVELNKEGLGLKIYDGYRPQKGVNHFIRWAKDQADTLTKQKYYPQVNKRDVFKLGYVASRSGHSRGSTVDLTIIDLKTGEELDMGSGWDFFGEISGHGYVHLSDTQKFNRLKLKTVMEKYGFRAYSKEWWHYTLRNEPFPETYFDFDVE